uniref:Putative SMAD/FHA domain-containing protein isoform 3 n=1 Tax=Davidia involucrata TaxID=16924 RepID=A0A5B6Z3N6_DAVIN
MDHNLSNHSESPVRGRGSPRKRSPSRRERSPARHRSSHAGSSPPREKPSSRTRSPKHAKSRSLVSRSPSPRTKQLRGAQGEGEFERVSGREHEKNHSRGGDSATHREKGSDREAPSERRERRSGRDAVASGSSRLRHARSTSPSDRHHRSRNKSRSPPPVANNRARVEGTNSRGAEHRNGDNDSVTKMKATEEALEAKETQKPSFELSGKLAAETNRVRGVTLLFTEPPDARKPDIRWRLYVFKAGEVLNEPLYVHRQSCYLFGRERRVSDIPTDHPSCSKQHAVLQYRQIDKEQPDGTSSKQVRPYFMDLGSTNGTFINDDRIEPQRYYELFEKDTIKFGNSSREYVLLHENSNG